MNKELLKKIETGTDIIDWEVGGIKIWRYERFSVYRYLTEIDKKGKANSAIARSASGIDLKKYVKLFFRRVAPMKKADILIFNHSRRALQGNVYVCKYTEKISDYYENTLTYETPFNDSHMEPTKTKNLRYLDRIILKSYVYEVLSKIIKKKEHEAIYQDIHNKLVDTLKDEYNDNVYSYLARAMTKNLYLIRYRKRAVKKIMMKVSPKVVIEVVGYSRNNMIVNECAKECGIPTIEMQHSQINDELIQYTWFGRNDIEQFPDYLFTFGDFWSEGLELPIPDENVKAVGFPYFEEEIKQSLKNKPNLKLQSDIVFISQYLAGPSVYELVMEYSQMNPDSKVIYKLHPEEYSIWEERYPKLKELSNITVVTDPKITLYDCFANTKAVVGVFSGALYEALAFDLPVYLYKADYIENMQKLIDVNGAIVINNAEELKKCLLEGNRAETPNLEIWKKNAFNNMIFEIDKIMKANVKK